MNRRSETPSPMEEHISLREKRKHFLLTFLCFVTGVFLIRQILHLFRAVEKDLGGSGCHAWMAGEQHSNFVGQKGELTVDIDTKIVHVHDGMTPGGFPLNYSVSVRRFGAKGDGVTDDSAAFEATIASLPSKGGAINIPAGIYLLSRPIILTKRIVLSGEGMAETNSINGAATIKKSASMSTSIISIQTHSCVIRDLTIIGASGNRGDGIEILGNGCSVTHTSVSSMGRHGIRVGSDTGESNSNSWSLLHVTSAGNGGHGLFVHDARFNANAGSAYRLNCLNNTEDGVRNENGDKNSYIGCLMEGNGGYGWHFTNAVPHQSYNSVVGGDAESNAKGDVMVGMNSWFNCFCNDGALGSTNYGRLTSLFSTKHGNRIASHGPGEILSNGPTGRSKEKDSTEHYSIYDASSIERVRFGVVNRDGVLKGLVPSQFMHDEYGAIVASRAVGYGSVRFAVGAGPHTCGGFYGADTSFWLGPGPTNANAKHVFFQAHVTNGWSGAQTAAYIGKNRITSRSINAAGTVNASGLDYAEYMTKADPSISIEKGSICGINSDGKLTTKYYDAVSFVVKSTNPSYVGGDGWASQEAIGFPPVPPSPFEHRETFKTQADADAYGVSAGAHDYSEALAKHHMLNAIYEQSKTDYEMRLSAERAKVDRIAFSGQVPVNVVGARAGDYIIPEADGDNIKGVPVPEATITFSQYRAAIGRVVNIDENHRTIIIVKTI